MMLLKENINHKIKKIMAIFQEKPVSKVWHNVTEKPKTKRFVVLTKDGIITTAFTPQKMSFDELTEKSRIKKWAYLPDLVNLDNSCNFGKNLQEEPVSIDFEQELYKAFGQVKDFTLGMRIAKWFYDMGKNRQKPVSEELEDAADLYVKSTLVGSPSVKKSAFKAGAEWQKKKDLKEEED